jgi:heme O synthase-like polyprenyltransferase
MKLINLSKKAYLAAGVALLPVLASAQTTTGTTSPTTIDFSPITNAFSVSSITTGIMAIAGIMAAVYVAWKGAKMILSFFRSA